MKIVATPRVLSEGHILVDLDMQNTHANNIAVGELADRLGNVALKETVALRPGVPVTAAVGKGWSVTASAKVLGLTEASQRSASASYASASKPATD